MKIDNGMYPYPVLSTFTEDYLNSSFDVEYSSSKKGFNTSLILVKFHLDDRVIEELISNETLSLIIHVECSRTSYRKLFKLNPGEMSEEIIIDPEFMVHKLEINGMIVTNKNLDYYNNPNINEKIYGGNFEIKNLEVGSIIAITRTQSINISMSKDSYNSVDSIINVGETDDEFMSVNYDDDLIIIKLPKKEYKRYFELSGTIYSSIIMTSTILPSLIYILDSMSGESSSVDRDLTWYRVIEEKISLKNYRVKDINESITSIELAQMILEDPLAKAFEEINNELERNSEE